MHDVNAPTRQELAGMLSRLVAMLSLLLATRYEHRATRSVLSGTPHAHGPRIREGSRDRRELGWRGLEQRMDADE